MKCSLLHLLLCSIWRPCGYCDITARRPCDPINGKRVFLRMVFLLPLELPVAAVAPSGPAFDAECLCPWRE